MNPNGIAVIEVGDESSDSHDHAAQNHDHTSHAHHTQAASGAQESQGNLHALPPCHRALALAVSAKPKAHDHAGDSQTSHGAHAGHAGHHAHSQTSAGDDSGHSHDSCPVCQGHAQLIQGLPARALPALTTLYQFHARVAHFAQTPRVLHTTTLPPARAPPMLSGV
ncbi:MAG: hypothetical protein NXI24_17080 [bacterium]|nr:hypothetical protein [bacterium]